MTQKWPKPAKINISDIEVYFFAFLCLSAHPGGVKRLVFKGAGWLDGTKMTIFGQKFIALPFFGGFGFKTINLLIWPHLATV